MTYTPPNNNPNGQATSVNSAPVVIANDQSPVGIQNELITFKDDFSGTSLDTTNNWTVNAKSGTAMASSVVGSLLTINTGTTANDYYAITSKQVFTTPMRMQIQYSLSARTSNTNFYFELVNAAGTVAATIGSLVANTGVTQVGWLLKGSDSATLGNIVAQNQGVKATADSSLTTNSSGSVTMLEIEARGDSVDFASRTSESTSTTSNTATRTRTILTPGENYYLQIRAVNGSTAPSSAVSLNIESVIMQDVTKTVVEVSGGRGNASSSKSMPVNVMNTVATSLAANTNVAGGFFPVPSTSAAGLNPFNNAAVSALTLVKSSAGRLHRIMVQNPNSSPVWLQVFNAASTGAVTLGTTTAQYPIYVAASGYFEDFFEYSDNFSSGIVIAATTTANGSTAPTTGLNVSLGYV